MKVLRFFFYSFFALITLLIVLSSFMESLFMPSEKDILKKIQADFGQQLKFQSYTWKNLQMGFVSVGNDTAQRIILVHGSPGSWTNYSMLLEHSEYYNQFNLIALDRVGYGMSSGYEGEPSLEEQAASIKELCIPSKGGRKPILIGHSLGGPIVIKSAIDYSQNLEGVISVAGSFNPDLEFNEFYRGIFKVFPINILFNRELQASNDELFTHRLELENMENDWEKIQCKVAILQGSKDVLVDPKNFDFAAQKLKNKNAYLLMIPNEDHFIPFTRPEPIFKAIEMIQQN